MLNRSPQLESVMAKAFPSGIPEFRPCAFFDDRLDCIRVLARDCSDLEERINDRLTVLIDNYATADPKRYVGFTIKGARHFCQEHGWDLSTSIKMTELLDALMASFPQLVVEWFISIVARPVVEQGKIEQVEVASPSPNHSLQPA